TQATFATFHLLARPWAKSSSPARFKAWCSQSGQLQPQIIISHRMTLEEATEGYRLFDKKVFLRRENEGTP
ncbi:hypothetical protein SAMN05216600_10650, partial [Pseudomonas cuatrocienegasensis]